MLGFEKNQRDNINSKELAFLKDFAALKTLSRGQAMQNILKTEMVMDNSHRLVLSLEFKPNHDECVF